jgi:hypothetical protein
LSIDGTVAAYRLPYLLAGGSLLFKVDSPYYEHFYRDLVAGDHYVAVKNDLSDLLERVKWAKDNDAEARRIAENARRFANENLLPKEVICYHALLIREWTKRLKGEVTDVDGMDRAEQEERKGSSAAASVNCFCDARLRKDEL